MLAKRPLCLFCVSFIAGIMTSNCFGLLFLLLFILFILIFTAIFFLKLKNYIVIIICCIACFLAGGFKLLHSERLYAGAFESFYNKPVLIEGYIDSDIERADDRTRFVVKVKKLITGKNENLVNGKLLINIYNSQDKPICNSELNYRSKVKLKTSIIKPKPATNPGGFDYKRYLSSLGISGTVSINNTSELKIIGYEKGGWLYRLGFGIKNKVLRIIEFCLDKNQAGLLSGMIIGYKDGLDENAFTAFSRAGLTHIMVASGMNVAFIILPLTFILNKLRFGKRTSNIFIIIILILFVFVTGFSASVVRAVIMGIVILIGQLLRRETDIYTSISLAALILLFINPFIIYDIGFQLSFGATISLVLLYPKIKTFVSRKHIPEIISDTLAATLSAQIGVIPITLYYFNSFSTISILSNLLVVPFVQIITIIGFIMVFCGLVNINLATLVGYVNNSLLSFVLFVTEYSSKLPYASIKLPTPDFSLILIYYGTVLYIILGRNKLKTLHYFRLIKYACISLIIVFYFVRVIIPKPLEITFVDVGQGDCSFIKTSHGTKVLIDGGGRAAGSKSSFDIGESVVLPYILDKGTKQIDIIIATHGHSDHTEGLETVLMECRVGTLFLPDTNGEGMEAVKKICLQRKIPVRECKKGDIIILDAETKMEVLSPLGFEKDILSQQSLNNSSLMLKLMYRNVKVLLTGDSEIPVEQRMLEQGLNLKADLVKIGHHGSISSTGQEFLDSVKPKFAVISVGVNNKFGHPSQFVVDRIEEKGIKLFRTDEKGAVVATSYGNDFKVETMLP